MIPPIADHIYCINLDHRTDRRHEASWQFLRNKLTVEFFSAIDGRTGVFGTKNCDNYNNACTLSHIGVIKDALIKGYKAVMVFEDDVILHDKFHEHLALAMIDLPDDWDLTYMGGSHRKPPIPITQNLMKVKRTLTTHAYIIRNTMYKPLLQAMSKLDQPVDGFFTDLQPHFNCFITEPVLAWQRKSYSDIQHRVMSYPWIKTNKQ